VQKLKKRREGIVAGPSGQRGHPLLGSRREGPPAGRGICAGNEDGEKNATEKLDQKKLDLICFNPADEADSGMDSDMNRVTLIDRRHRIDALPRMPKWEVSRKIWDKIEQLMAEGRG